MRIQLQSKPDYALLVYGATTLKIDNFSQFDGYVDTSPTQAAALTGAGVKWTRVERRGAVRDRRMIPDNFTPAGSPMRRLTIIPGRRAGDHLAPERRLARSARRVIPYGRRHTQFSFAGADRRGIDMPTHVGRRGEPHNGRRKGDRVPEDRRSGPRRVNTATARAISYRGISTRTTFGRRGRDQREKVY